MIKNIFVIKFIIYLLRLKFKLKSLFSGFFFFFGNHFTPERNITTQIQEPPNNFFLEKCFKKKKTTEYFLKFLSLFESTIDCV